MSENNSPSARFWRYVDHNMPGIPPALREVLAWAYIMLTWWYWEWKEASYTLTTIPKERHDVSMRRSTRMVRVFCILAGICLVGGVLSFAKGPPLLGIVLAAGYFLCLIATTYFNVRIVGQQLVSDEP